MYDKIQLPKNVMDSVDSVDIHQVKADGAKSIRGKAFYENESLYKAYHKKGITQRDITQRAITQ